MKKFFILLSFIMGVVVLTSNYLVQFPINYYGFGRNINLWELLVIQLHFFKLQILANRSYGKVVARKKLFMLVLL